MSGYVRPTEPLDILQLAPNLRQGDIDELTAASGVAPQVALEAGFILSDIPLTICLKEDDSPVAMFGTVNLHKKSAKIGQIWLLGSDDMGKVGMRFARECKDWIRVMQENYDLLWNVVDKRNTVHIRWLKWCGFSFMREIPQYGKAQLPFYEFYSLK